MTAFITPSDVVAFWKEAGPEKWFAKDEAFDADFRDRGHALHWTAARRERDDWMDTAEGALALLILLDQYPRNSFRSTAHQFATDPLALCRSVWTDILTERELEVAMLVVDCASNRDAASQLYVSVRTVEVHLGRVFAKLGVRSRVELSVLAHRMGRDWRRIAT